MRLTTIGRRTGRARAVIVGYFEDGPDLVTTAMNGWGDGEPAWWLNLQAHPDVTVDLVDGPPRSPAGQHRATSESVCGPDGERSPRTSIHTPRAAR